MCVCVYVYNPGTCGSMTRHIPAWPPQVSTPSLPARRRRPPCRPPPKAEQKHKHVNTSTASATLYNNNIVFGVYVYEYIVYT